MNQEEATRQLAQTEQTLEHFSLQQQQFSQQLADVKASLVALNGEQKAFKLIGQLMFEQSADDLRSSLKEQEERLTVRLRSVEDQLRRLREKKHSLQEQILQEVQEKRK